MALRYAFPTPFPDVLSVTVVRGCRAAVAFETYRPVFALRA
jgi:hypothetical protein